MEMRGSLRAFKDSIGSRAMPETRRNWPAWANAKRSWTRDPRIADNDANSFTNIQTETQSP